MSFYNLSKEERTLLINKINNQILNDIMEERDCIITSLFADDDTYIRKAAYQAIGKYYKSCAEHGETILKIIKNLFEKGNKKIRQTAVNAAGEIGIYDFKSIEEIMGKGLSDPHHIVRNAVIGSIKKMGEKNPVPVLVFAKKHLHDPDKEIRREICHGIELRGRTHPEDILPLLKELEHDKTARVKNTLIHVLGQIAYKKGCLEKVIEHLKSWENKDLVANALEEIIEVHERYKDFAIKRTEDAANYIKQHFQ